jgi:hypothetical protein
MFVFCSKCCNLGLPRSTAAGIPISLKSDGMNFSIRRRAELPLISASK